MSKKMSNSEKQYLDGKMRAEVSKVKAAFAKDRITDWDKDAILAKLTEAGFTTRVRDNAFYQQNHFEYAAGYLSFPPTDEMTRNRQHVKEFNAKVDAAYAESKDVLYLGGADALTMLREFQDKLASLVQA